MKRNGKRILPLLLCVLLGALLLSGCDALTRELSGVMSAEEVAALDRYKNLKTLDLRGSTCYDAIEAYIAAHPQVAVSYTVDVAGTPCDPGIDSITIAPQDAEALAAVSRHLPKLRSIDLEGGGVTAETLRVLWDAIPEARLRYSVDLLGQSLPGDTKTLDLSGLSHAQAAEAAEALRLLPALETVQLLDGAGESALPVEDFIALKSAAPQAAFSYRCELYGQEVSTETESLSYVNTEIGNEGAALFMRLLPCLDRLQRLSLDTCGIDDEVMAQMRDAFPDKEIVWRVVVGWKSFMSDVETVWAIGGLSDEQLEPLKYCTKVKYLDLGHNGITKLDFVLYMPDLEVAIFENDDLEDITLLGTCKNLEYLEIGETNVGDISPLANCTNLQHLCIGGLYKVTDITPLYGLTKLVRLNMICDTNIPQYQIDEIQALLPGCYVEAFYSPMGPMNGGSWRYFGGAIAPRYALLHDQIGYDW